MSENNVAGGYLAAIDFLGRAVIGAQRGTVQRDAGKKSAGARVSKDLRVHQRVGCSLRIAALGTSSGGGISAELDLALEDGINSLGIHHQQHEVRGLATELKTNIAAFQRYHRGCPPWPGKS